MDGCVKGCMDGWVCEGMCGWMNVCMIVCIDRGWIHE